MYIHGREKHPSFCSAPDSMKQQLVIAQVAAAVMRRK